MAPEWAGLTKGIQILRYGSQVIYWPFFSDLPAGKAIFSCTIQNKPDSHEENDGIYPRFRLRMRIAVRRLRRLIWWPAANRVGIYFRRFNDRNRIGDGHCQSSEDEAVNVVSIQKDILNPIAYTWKARREASFSFSAICRFAVRWSSVMIKRQCRYDRGISPDHIHLPH